MSGEVAFNFAGKAALVVGGTSGIGWATARALARAGAKVAVCDLAPSPPPAFERQLREDGAPDALFLPLDVRSAPDVERAVATRGPLRRFPGRRQQRRRRGALRPAGSAGGGRVRPAGQRQSARRLVRHEV